jgi:predicted DNA-binding transcriptional regulator YafY
MTRAARVRYLIIDKCLRNTKFKWSADSLLFQVNCKLQEDWFAAVSTAQLNEDVKVMSEKYHAPIITVKEGKQLFFEYSDPLYSIKHTPLDTDELNKLQEASQILTQIRNFSFSEDIAYVINRLDNRVKLSQNEHSIVHFDDVGASGFTEHLEAITAAIISTKVLKIVYRKLASSMHDDFIVHPYFLKEYQGRWYLFGYSETSKGPRLYALDRILEMEPVTNVYFENRFISSDIYFNHLIGVLVNGNSKPEDIALWISPKMAPLVLSKPIHQSQFRENFDSSGLFIQLHVVINPELITLLLSYGADLKVLYPAHLADQIKETAWKIAEQYNKE